MQIKVSVDSAVEALVDGAPHEVVVAGASVSGAVTLLPSGRNAQTFSSLSLKHTVKNASGDSETIAHVELLTAGKYTLSEAQVVPFTYVLPKSTPPSYNGAACKIVHGIVVTATGVGGFLGASDVELEHGPLAVQAAPAAKKAAAAFVTVDDYGGECTLRLPCGSTLPLGGVVTGSLHVDSKVPTADIARVLVKILAVESASGPRLLREIELWNGKDPNRPELSAKPGVEVRLRLPAGHTADDVDLLAASGVELLGPSVARTTVAGAPCEVKHLLRLVIEPIPGSQSATKTAEAWNTIEVGLTVAQPPSGAAVGTLRPVGTAHASGPAGVLSGLLPDVGSWTPVNWLAFVAALALVLVITVLTYQQMERAEAERSRQEWLESGRRAMERLAELHRQGKTIRDHPFRTHDMEDVAMDEDAPETWVEGKGWVKV